MTAVAAAARVRAFLQPGDRGYDVAGFAAVDELRAFFRSTHRRSSVAGVTETA